MSVVGQVRCSRAYTAFRDSVCDRSGHLLALSRAAAIHNRVVTLLQLFRVAALLDQDYITDIVLRLFPPVPLPSPLFVLSAGDTQYPYLSLLLSQGGRARSFSNIIILNAFQDLLRFLLDFRHSLTILLSFRLIQILSGCWSRC